MKKPPGVFREDTELASTGHQRHAGQLARVTRAPYLRPMTDQPPPKWALLFLSGVAVFSGVAFVYGWVRGGFELIRLAVFVLFAAMAADTWQKRRKG